METKVNVYELITQRIISQLEAGTVPWHKPWRSAMNLISKRPYRGINRLLIGSIDTYESPFWLTYKQAQELGGNVRKGEHGNLVVFWKPCEAKPKDEAESDEKGKTYFLLRYYYVFNLDQCEGIPEHKIPAAPDGADVDESAEQIAAKYLKSHGPSLKHGGSRACYSPERDSVQMPPKASFESTAGYYATLFHELTHSTGHRSRLARKEIELCLFGTKSYAAEELVAELGSAMICGVTGIEPKQVQDNQAAYIASWLTALRNDKQLLVTAASRAQKAADMIQGQPVEVEQQRAA